MTTINKLCSIEGCSKPFYGKGLCQPHYLRMWRHGDPLAGGTSRGDPQRFYDEIVLPYEGAECLIWPYARNKGYAVLRRGGGAAEVHRLVCEDVNGPPPTPDHEAAHSCGNGDEGCVTKGHLSWKTHAENMADTLFHGTSNRGDRHGMSKLGEDEAREIISLKGREPQKSIAKRFGVSRGTVGDIQRGRTWSWLQPNKEMRLLTTVREALKKAGA